MWRVLMAMALAAVVLSAVTVSAAALLKLDAGNLAVFTFPVHIEVPPVSATVDIKPCSDPNSINLGNEGVIPVAILTSEDFDATTVDPGTVVFAGASPVDYAFEDVCPQDGDDDLVLHFRTQETNIEPDATEACLQGTTYEGVSIEGCDSVLIAGADSPAVGPALAPPTAPSPTPIPLALPGATTDYEIQPGDTLWDIAIRFGTTVEELVRLNQLQTPSLILYGSTLNVPYVGEDGGDASAGVSPQSRRASGRRSGQ